MFQRSTSDLAKTLGWIVTSVRNLIIWNIGMEESSNLVKLFEIEEGPIIGRKFRRYHARVTVVPIFNLPGDGVYTCLRGQHDELKQL